MKKILYVMFVLSVLLSAVFIFAGCEDGNDTAAPTSLVGTWTGISNQATANAFDISVNVSLKLIVTQSQFALLVDNYLGFSGSYTSTNSSVMFNYTHSGGLELFDIVNDSLDYVINGNVVTFSNSISLDGQTFTKNSTAALSSQNTTQDALIGTWTGTLNQATADNLDDYGFSFNFNDSLELIVTQNQFIITIDSESRFSGLYTWTSGSVIFNFTHQNGEELDSTVQEGLDYVINGDVITFSNSIFFDNQTLSKNGTTAQSQLIGTWKGTANQATADGIGAVQVYLNDPLELIATQNQFTLIVDNDKDNKRLAGSYTFTDSSVICNYTHLNGNEIA